MEPRIQYAKTKDGVNIAYSVMGDGPLLVRAAVPGITHAQRDWAMYQDVWGSLTRSLRLVFYDSRGTGLSDRDAIDFSMEAMMRDLEAVVDREGLETFAMAGFFWGVRIAVAYAAAQPERVSHIVLVDGPARPVVTPATEAAEALVDKDWRLFTETVARVLAGIDDAEWTKKWAEHFRASCEPDAFRAAMTVSSDVTGLLSSVRAQTLVVHSERSALTPLSASRELAAGISGARLVMLGDPTLRGLDQLIDEFLGDGEEAATEPPEVGAFRTVLFTDVEGSTALTQRLGDARARELLREHERAVREALKAHGGSEVKTMGDGFMASFSSATKALECAIAMQRAFAAHNESAEEPIQVRIGLNAGEPIAEDEDLFGTAVNRAARIAALAQGGEILVANVVRELAEGKEFMFGDRGETALRGFDDPVRLFEVRWQPDS